jgi:HEAT repeats
MTKYPFLILVGLALAAALRADVGPIPGEQAVRPLFEAADLVCFCSVRSVEAQGPKTGPDGNASRPGLAVAGVRVENLYKSSGPDPVSATVQYEEGQLWKGERAILFLKLTASAVYELADPFIGATPFGSIPPASSNSGLPGLESTLAVLARPPDRDDQMNAMKLLQGFDSLEETTTSELISLSSSKDSQIALSALAVLLKNKRPENVERLRTYLANYSSDSAPISLVSIGTELSQVRDEKALPNLEALTDSMLVSIRMGAMQALRAMKNPKAAGTLVKRLDDTDSYVRYLAVISLAETFGKYGDFAPSMYLFDRNPEFHLGLWKSWWATEGQMFQPNPGSRQEN